MSVRKKTVFLSAAACSNTARACSVRSSQRPGPSPRMVIAVDIVMPHPLYIMPACIYSGLFLLPPLAARWGEGSGDTPHPAKGPCWPLGPSTDQLHLLLVV